MSLFLNSLAKSRHSDLGVTCISIGVEARKPKMKASAYRIIRLISAWRSETTAIFVSKSGDVCGFAV